MPQSYIQNEHKWERSKQIVRDQYGLDETDDRFYPLVMGVYKQARGEIKSKKQKQENPRLTDQEIRNAMNRWSLRSNQFDRVSAIAESNMASGQPKEKALNNAVELVFYLSTRQRNPGEDNPLHTLAIEMFTWIWERTPNNQESAHREALQGELIPLLKDKIMEVKPKVEAIKPIWQKTRMEIQRERLASMRAFLQSGQRLPLDYVEEKTLTKPEELRLVYRQGFVAMVDGQEYVIPERTMHEWYKEVTGKVWAGKPSLEILRDGLIRHLRLGNALKFKVDRNIWISDPERLILEANSKIFYRSDLENDLAINVHNMRDEWEEKYKIPSTTPYYNQVKQAILDGLPVSAEVATSWELEKFKVARIEAKQGAAFSVGDRVVIATHHSQEIQGRHGKVIKWRYERLITEEKPGHFYDVKTDNGAIVERIAQAALEKELEPAPTDIVMDIAGLDTDEPTYTPWTLFAIVKKEIREADDKHRDASRKQRKDIVRKLESEAQEAERKVSVLSRNFLEWGRSYPEKAREAWKTWEIFKEDLDDDIKQRILEDIKKINPSIYQELVILLANDTSKGYSEEDRQRTDNP